MQNKKNVLIWGAGSHNLGADLMLRTVVDLIGTEFNLIFYPSHKFGRLDYMASLGLKPLFSVRWRGIYFRRLLNVSLLKRVRERYSLITIEEIDVIIDINGYAYGDKWGNRAFDELKWLMTSKAKILLLPQCFGPFDKITRRRSQSLKYVDYIWARDRKSSNYLKENRISHEIAPDFTLKYVQSFQTDVLRQGILIIPNVRLIEHDEHYLPWLKQTVEYLSQVEEVKICYQSNEDKVAFQAHFSDYKYFEVNDSRDYISLINNFRIVLSGRFHGAVVALSLSIPCFMNSWNHKYEELALEYNISWLISSFGKPIADSYAKVCLEYENITENIKHINGQRSKEIEQLFSFILKEIKL